MLHSSHSRLYRDDVKGSLGLVNRHEHNIPFFTTLFATFSINITCLFLDLSLSWAYLRPMRLP